MMRLMIVTAVGLLLGQSTAVAGEVADKCEAAMTSVGAPNAATGCACFDDALSDTERADYMAMDLALWASAATETMKAAAATCFPDSNTNAS
ncbi:MAG: hypothetical protein AAFR65_13910 [Pseudomonadota bacterium]